MKKVILLTMHKNRGCDYLFYSYFDYLCKRKGVTKNKACQEMGVSRSVAAKWKSTQTNPSMATLQKISDYFGVTLDELLAQSEDIEKPTVINHAPAELTADEQQLLALYRSMNASGRTALLAAANGFANSPAYTYKDRLNQVENDRFRRFFFVLLHFYACFGDITKIEKC